MREVICQEFCYKALTEGSQYFLRILDNEVVLQQQLAEQTSNKLKSEIVELKDEKRNPWSDNEFASLSTCLLNGSSTFKKDSTGHRRQAKHTRSFLFIGSFRISEPEEVPSRPIKAFKIIEVPGVCHRSICRELAPQFWVALK